MTDSQQFGSKQEVGPEQMEASSGAADADTQQDETSAAETTFGDTEDGGRSSAGLAAASDVSSQEGDGEDASRGDGSAANRSPQNVADPTFANPEIVDTLPSDDEMSDMSLFTQYLDEGLDFDLPQRGDLREGMVVEIRPNELLVNIGAKRDGVVPQTDLSRLDPEIVRNLQVGDTVAVVVSRTADDDNSFLLSISEALQRQDWQEAQRLLDTGEMTVHQVVGFNKGGVTVEFNHLRGFVPASHLVDMPRNLSEEERRAELESRIGDEVRLKVIEVERRRRRLVMSQMLAEREYRAQQKETLFERLRVGDIIEGEVRGMRPFGAFVDIGGADGLLHVSEIDWVPVNHPQDVLQKGQKLEVQIIRMNPEKQQIALSRKRLLPNPWDGVEERYHAGDIVRVVITRVVDFGAFAQLEPGVEGLIHISELADIAVAEPLSTVQPGDEIDVKILRVDEKRHRVGLSRRQAPGADFVSPQDAEADEDADFDIE
jgi:small subunit ribosomal protein S1